eukprot:scaffold102844_cov21-Tisochrysis_lutea.AAC.1
MYGAACPSLHAGPSDKTSKPQDPSALCVPLSLHMLLNAHVRMHMPIHPYQLALAVPIPPYLLALAVGELEARELSPRSRVWSEPSMVDAGAYEFADTAKYLEAGACKRSQLYSSVLKLCLGPHSASKVMRCAAQPHWMSSMNSANVSANSWESIAGPYVWGRYDLLLLPPSFPYGVSAVDDCSATLPYGLLAADG